MNQVLQASRHHRAHNWWTILEEYVQRRYDALLSFRPACLHCQQSVHHDSLVITLQSTVDGNLFGVQILYL